jgi:hypothetical protein
MSASIPFDMTKWTLDAIREGMYADARLNLDCHWAEIEPRIAEVTELIARAESYFAQPEAPATDLVGLGALREVIAEKTRPVTPDGGAEKEPSPSPEVQPQWSRAEGRGLIQLKVEEDPDGWQWSVSVAAGEPDARRGRGWGASESSLEEAIGAALRYLDEAVACLRTEPA